MRTAFSFSKKNNSNYSTNTFHSSVIGKALAFFVILGFIVAVFPTVASAQLGAKAIGTNEWKTLENKNDPQSAARWQELKDKGQIVAPEQSTYKGELTFPGQLAPLSGLMDATPSLKLPKDSSFTVVPFIGAAPPMHRNDDYSSPVIHLPFAFNLYGSSYNALYINNNGNLSFDQPYYTFSSTGFPVNRYPMIAPFWADVDTRNQTSGVVYYKIESHRLTVIWENVGYYNQQAGKKNTFEVIISDGTDSLVGIGNNICFSYADMQWTAGTASGGVGGLGGVPATIGVNKGDGTNFAQLGRFNHAGTDYDGPGNGNDGVDYLDGHQVCFYAGSPNIPPIANAFPIGNQVDVVVGTTYHDTVYFLSPELGQVTHTLVDPSGLAHFDYISTDGNVSAIELTFTPDDSQVGDHVIHFTAIDNGVPVESTSVDLTLHVLKLATISGMKFNDINGNGVKDANEPGIAGWNILLNNGLQSVQTDSAGRFIFTRITPGTYTISESQELNWAQSYPSSGQYSVTVDVNNDYTGYDFGNYQYSTIYGMKFHDININGLRDPDEPGLAGWVIRLTGATSDTFETDAKGTYQFMNVVPGEYTVSEDQRAGWKQTAPATGTYSLTVHSGDFIDNIDFGNIPLGIVAGTKFEDANGDSIWNNNERGLPGWIIHLVGPIMRDTITDSKGHYSFSYLVPGNYEVSEEPQPGWSQTFPYVSNTYSINVELGNVYNGNDFGNFNNGSISGLKFNDSNGNGTLDSGEPGIENWKIFISRNGEIAETTYTDANGFYQFSDLGPGTYYVNEELSSGWTQTYGAGGYTQRLQSGDSLVDKTFGNFKNITISGMKFDDKNGDGSQEINDGGIAGWTILLSKDGQPAESTLTNADGYYSFEDLGPGVYTVAEETQSGWTQTYGTAGYSVTATSGDNVTDRNFGNFKNITITGTKFEDENGNGTFDQDETS